MFDISPTRNQISYMRGTLEASTQPDRFSAGVVRDNRVFHVFWICLSVLGSLDP